MQLTKILKNQLCEKKGRKLAFSNKDLPDGVHNKDHWHKHFIPTFLWWVGKQPDPWNLAYYDIVDTLQEIWDVIYKKIPYVVEQKDAVFAVAMQCISDSWHATFGSTAITIIKSIFENSEDGFSTDDDDQVFAQHQLDNLEFLYRDTDSMPYHHPFQGPLILHTLAAHYCAIHGAIKILSLGDADLLTNQPYGALAMSATVVEHGFTLIAKGNITIEAIAQSKMTHKKLVFEQSSSDVKRKTNFSNKFWGKVTCEYVHATNHLLKESKEQLYLEVRQISNDMTSHYDRDQLAMSSNTQVKEASLGHCAMLIDIA
ncbi:hypothetical protein BU17DRAFT_88282 [Hysterangium stoloniferum]|nr:hypothetical protein BU17DRAFT_88282 [Hysterangium stoloniferum]